MSFFLFVVSDCDTAWSYIPWKMHVVTRSNYVGVVMRFESNSMFRLPQDLPLVALRRFGD